MFFSKGEIDFSPCSGFCWKHTYVGIPTQKTHLLAPGVLFRNPSFMMKHPLCVITIIHQVNYLSCFPWLPFSHTKKAQTVCITLIISYMHLGDFLLSVIDNIVVVWCHWELMCLCVCLFVVPMQWTAEMDWTQKLEVSLFFVIVESGNEKEPDGGEMIVSKYKIF